MAQDTNVSPAMGEYLAQMIANCQASFVPDAGHLLGMVQWEEILWVCVGAERW